MAVASPPASRISLATVSMVESQELGSGGNGEMLSTGVLLVDLAAATTVSPASEYGICVLFGGYGGGGEKKNPPAYPLAARSMATCRPMPLDAPMTRATGLE